MSKSVAWAYSIAGLAVAVAIIVVAGSTAGLIGSAAEKGPGQAVAVGVPPAADGALLASADTQGAASDAGVEDVEYVYVDAPVSDRDYDDDDDHDDDDRDHHDDDHDDDRDHDDDDEHDRDDDD